ncbi:polar amino acid transport system permease protein [Clostridium saccharoperbutylacetonicum]|uniref:Amino acid ABC transporter membrane protein, PAAT family n=1 Tax=Clostridium saccharoperbutylacetonicum N1-4(HMT) TaxID=931276 RepID=M1MB48_9CLOT|nr:amino acid ABC transporter permease [Clostridium saccharoperbutylacetonicum]AGF55169.1 amino acid ABC transporter membrane protein, PAAT family [Clostridium saccharoperbutylacetonicum N1-4(HMT)]NRT64120.1 polar amino acid transport system permease protein [Clostridium saccharoperbutylacetonicum]NSB27487.1 polar amino acid transport system permease protein [Clostridium saccharoperbutylacetonicum]NSB40976.1 polar amino acid transport system permease protein [Clostridium saccharoperbutylacetoni
MPNIFDFKLVFTEIPELLKYLPMTLEITILSMIFGLIIGLMVAIVKIKQIPVLKRVVAVFVSFTRGTPIIVQLYLTYYGIPILLKYYNYYNGTNYNLNNIPSLLFVLVAFSLNEAAYNSESIRAAIQSIDKGQTEAAHSLGMTSLQVLRRITIPEAFVVALPTLGNALIGLLKGTSLAFVCSVVEMTAQGKILAGSNYRYFEVYVSLAIIYWVLTIIIEQIIRFVEKRMSIPDSIQNQIAKEGVLS